MPTLKKTESEKDGPRRPGAAPIEPSAGSEPLAPPDRILREIRKFIAAVIFFNAQVADKVGLSLTDLQLINMLLLYGPSTPGHLGKWTGLSSGGVTVALDRLEKAGYIRRLPNPADRRSLLITLLPARLRKLTAMYEGVEQETRAALAAFSQSDLDVVIRFFEVLDAARRATNLAPRP